MRAWRKNPPRNATAIEAEGKLFDSHSGWAIPTWQRKDRPAPEDGAGEDSAQDRLRRDAATALQAARLRARRYALLQGFMQQGRVLVRRLFFLGRITKAAGAGVDPSRLRAERHRAVEKATLSERIQLERTPAASTPLASQRMGDTRGDPAPRRGGVNAPR
jgi:hypothetical protein